MSTHAILLRYKYPTASTVCNRYNRSVPSVIIVSNRLPVSVSKVNGELKFTQSGGGLATSMSFYTERRNSKWIGWPGIVSDELTEQDKQNITKRLAKSRCYPVFLSRKQIDAFYNGFSNSILWPYFHNLPTNLTNHKTYWKAYRQVNLLFAETVLAVSQPKSIIWVHDYQLMLLPSMLRTERPAESIGFFLHTPWPVVESFKKFPHAKSILQGLLGADLVGFHTTAYANHFLDVSHELHAGVVDENQIILPDRVVKVTDFPISIDYLKFAEANKSEEVQKEVTKLRRKYGKYKIILTVDRMDLTKGFIERLTAYQEFLQINTNQHGKVMMLMLAIPSRTDIDAYQKLKEKVEELVEDINNTYGNSQWKPIIYMFKSVPFEELSAMYQIADIAFVTPLQDGMNLVAKEYVASKHNKNGVLILSQTAGAAEELTNALLVNPAKPKSLVVALSKALSMKPKELQRRLNTMQEHLAVNTVQDWASNFMKTLQEPVPGTPGGTHYLRNKRLVELLTDFRATKSRLILLDYDGVLARFRSDPNKARPTTAIRNLLKKLASSPENELVLISGRSRADLEKWFGHYPISLAAEHGAVIKYRDQDWEKAPRSTTSWKKILLPSLEKYAAKTPGAFVEEKERTLVWHFRKASPYHAQKNIVILKRSLKPFLKPYGLGQFMGNGILEIKLLSANKGIATAYWLKSKPEFILAIGDDYTDEDMFMVMPPHAYSLKVGRGRTAARYRFDTVKEVQDLLRKLTHMPV